MSNGRELWPGLAAGLGAFVIWGLAPLYFKLISQVRADEIVAHRIVWSLLLLLLILYWRYRGNFIDQIRIRPRVLIALSVSSLLIAVNWLVFIHAVNTDRVLSTSLGYFINPLVNVVLGVLVFRERLSWLQGLAVALAAAGTIWMTVRAGQLPWIALVLSFSFAFYGLVRKKTEVGALPGLFWETLLLAPLAVIWLLWLGGAGILAFSLHDGLLSAQLAGTGLLTLVPLVLFAAGVRRLNLSTIGLMQYIAPSLSFVLAVFLFGESFGLDHAITFGCIWTALALFTWSGWRHYRRGRVISGATE